MSDPRDDRTLEALLKLAGPGPEPSADASARARAAVHADWRGGVRARRLRVRLLGGALLAAGLTAIALRPGWPLAGPPVPVATVERALAGATPPVGHALAAGASIDTGLGRIALRTAAGASLRLDARTRLVWLSASRVTLRAGALYLDSGASRLGFVVDTPQGRLVDEGTLFEARLLEDDRLRVRVREGRVRLGAARAEAGEELSARGGRVERARVAPSGPEWEWAEALAVAPAIDGQPLRGFLEWAARERGLQLRFADEATRTRAGLVRLRGSVADLTPAEALAAVAPTTGLRLRLEGDRLTVDGAQ
jgi:hypothetical protein